MKSKEDDRRGPRRVAIIGAGIAGLTCARRLADAGWTVDVVDKARGPGGRSSTRRREGFAFDHGAQYFTARSEAFERAVKAWQAQGVVDRWEAREAGADRESRWVGVPRMSALCRHLARDLDVHLSTQVVGLERAADHTWQLVLPAGALGPFDFVVIAVPAPQARALLATHSELAATCKRLANHELEPCWAVSVAFPAPLDTGFEVARWSDSPLAWVARNASKPGRAPAECWVLHASSEWSREHLEDEPALVARRLLGAFEARLPDSLPEPTYLDAHRWRYARADRPLGEACWIDRTRGIGLCGDWLLGGRIEAAWTSGDALAAALLESGDEG